MRKIGFTGTRKGMTEVQLAAFMKILGTIATPQGEFHHGDCVGADEQAHNIALACGLRTVVHPPINETHRAFCEGEARPKKNYIERNHDIVDETDTLIAAPATMWEEIRSGTWATVRYARLKQKVIVLVMPDGRIK